MRETPVMATTWMAAAGAAMLFFLASGAFASSGPGGDAVAGFTWVPTNGAAPLTQIDLGQGEKECLRLKGALTLAAVVQLEMQPATKKSFISKWLCKNDGRSYELGVQPDRTVFFAVSESGLYDRRACEISSEGMLKTGVSYSVVGVFVPGREMTIYINGHASGTAQSGIPKAVYDSETPVLLGNRPGEKAANGFKGVLKEVWILPSAAKAETISNWTKALGLTVPPEAEFGSSRELPAIRAITKGPKFHWFGYYDKLEFDPTSRYVLGMESGFENRSPTPDDVIKVGMVDLKDHDKWIELGESRAWCWQQGCMLQWRPGSTNEVLWNDRQAGRFVCHILDVKTLKKRTIPYPHSPLTSAAFRICGRGMGMAVSRIHIKSNWPPGNQGSPALTWRVARANSLSPSPRSPRFLMDTATCPR
jgi:Concanavalin A-like lectin/glucanases superfamily